MNIWRGVAGYLMVKGEVLAPPTLLLHDPLSFQHVGTVTGS